MESFWSVCSLCYGSSRQKKPCKKTYLVFVTIVQRSGETLSVASSVHVAPALSEKETDCFSSGPGVSQRAGGDVV